MSSMSISKRESGTGRTIRAGGTLDKKCESTKEQRKGGTVLEGYSGKGGTALEEQTR